MFFSMKYKKKNGTFEKKEEKRNEKKRQFKSYDSFLADRFNRKNDAYEKYVRMLNFPRDIFVCHQLFLFHCVPLNFVKTKITREENFFFTCCGHRVQREE